MGTNLRSVFPSLVAPSSAPLRPKYETAAFQLDDGVLSVSSNCRDGSLALPVAEVSVTQILREISNFLWELSMRKAKSEALFSPPTHE